MQPNAEAITNKDAIHGVRKKKVWRVKSREGRSLEFLPIFESNPENGDIEARWLEFRFLDAKGQVESMNFNWLDIYMFVYFTCNEELRRNLALRYERQVKYIPYDVTVILSEEEKKAGKAERRVELQVDELVMAIARNEAFKILMKGKMKDPSSFKYENKPHA